MAICGISFVLFTLLASVPFLDLELDPDFSIGLDGAHPLGYAVAMEVDPEGHVYLLDSGFKTLSEYDAHGNFVRTLMGEGEGPGELQNPTAMTLASDRKLYVSGRSTRVSVIDVDGGEPESLRADYLHNPRGLAVLANGDYVLSGFDTSNRLVLHQYDRSTQERVRSFSESYAKHLDVHPRQEQIEAGGLVEQIGDRLVYLQLNPPELRVFDLHGKLLVRHETGRADAIPTRPMEQKGDSFKFFTPQSGARSLIPLGGDQVLMALYRRPDLDVPDSVSTILYVVDLDSGEVLARSERDGGFTPQCIDRNGHLYVGAVEDDIPVVRRYRLKR